MPLPTPQDTVNSHNVWDGGFLGHTIMMGAFRTLVAEMLSRARPRRLATRARLSLSLSLSLSRQLGARHSILEKHARSSRGERERHTQVDERQKFVLDVSKFGASSSRVERERERERAKASRASRSQSLLRARRCERRVLFRRLLFARTHREDVSNSRTKCAETDLAVCVRYTRESRRCRRSRAQLSSAAADVSVVRSLLKFLDWPVVPGLEKLIATKWRASSKKPEESLQTSELALLRDFETRRVEERACSASLTTREAATAP